MVRKRSNIMNEHITKVASQTCQQKGERRKNNSSTPARGRVRNRTPALPLGKKCFGRNEGQNETEIVVSYPTQDRKTDSKELGSYYV